eukprot:TRINITY_DN11977_c0_g2_i1.p2 TRINITY_DN11977_c0_g2~~TRINITY_DN11977_c0_g2_i1.p2  ORF type:complete len:287 (+),score=98.27 TRINITY_DN11977_c0_g2_i1:73-933(+)
MPVEPSDLTAAAAATTMVAGAATSLIEPITGLTLIASGMTAMFASEKQRALRKGYRAAAEEPPKVDLQKEAELKQRQDALAALVESQRREAKVLRCFAAAAVAGGGVLLYVLWRKRREWHGHHHHHHGHHDVHPHDVHHHHDHRGLVVGVPLASPEGAEAYARGEIEAMQAAAMAQIHRHGDERAHELGLAAAAAASARQGDTARLLSRFAVGDQVRFVGGGRFEGPQVWEGTPDRLDVGEEGTVRDILTAGAWRVVVHFPHVNVRVGPEDIEPVHTLSASTQKTV